MRLVHTESIKNPSTYSVWGEEISFSQFLVNFIIQYFTNSTLNSSPKTDDFVRWEQSFKLLKFIEGVFYDFDAFCMLVIVIHIYSLSWNKAFMSRRKKHVHVLQ